MQLFQVRRQAQNTVPVKQRTLEEILRPQPKASAVMHRLLEWIERADRASQKGEPKLAFRTEGGEAIFPLDEENQWWLTELQVRKDEKAACRIDESLEDGPHDEEDNVAADDEEVSNASGDLSLIHI